MIFCYVIFYILVKDCKTFRMKILIFIIGYALVQIPDLLFAILDTIGNHSPRKKEIKEGAKKEQRK